MPDHRSLTAIEQEPGTIGLRGRIQTQKGAEGSGGSRSRLSLRKKTLFSFITVLAAFALLELGARILVTALPNIAWDAHSRHFSAKGFPDFAKMLTPCPECFWKLKSGLDRQVQTGRMGKFPLMRYAVSTDARGFRQVRDVHGAQQTILFLGDSRMFGMGVENEQTIPARVQRELEGAQCINAAVPGYTSYQGRVLLEQTEFDPPPDVVVIAFGVNEMMSWDSRGDLEHAEIINAKRRELIACSRFIGLLRTVLPTNYRQPRENTKRPRLTGAEFATQLRGMIRWCRAQGARPVLVHWPLAAQMLREGNTPNQQILFEIAHSEQVPLVDLLPALRSHGGVNLYLDAIHANAGGCERAAGAILPTLRSALVQPTSERIGQD